MRCFYPNCFFTGKRFLLFVLLLLAGIPLAAQPMVLQGRVTDAQSGSPLAQLAVVLRSSRQQILKYALTDKNGMFRLVCTEPEKDDQPGTMLVFSYMGYGEQRIAVEKADLLTGKHYGVQMKQEAMQIREVVVQAPKVQMRGDTLTYNVQSFANAQDKSIGDVIKRMPGMEVDESGRVKYNGEPINKFYIEGADLLEGRYGLATNQISRKDVAKVEVLENHQPIKALKNRSFSDKAAINIKLREGAKAKWVTELSAAAGMGEAAMAGVTAGAGELATEVAGEQGHSNGAPPSAMAAGAALQQPSRSFLWNGGLFSMRIAGKNQSMHTIKTNNTGTDLTGLSGSIQMDERNDNLYSRYSFPGYLSVSPARVPNMDGARTRFNKSVLANSSNLWKLGNDYVLKGEAAYLYNQIESANSSETVYFFEQGNRVDQEQTAAVQRIHGVQAGVDLTANTENYYLKNRLSGEVKWNRTESAFQWRSNQVGEGSGGDAYKQVLQRAKLPELNLSNDFRLVKNLDKMTITFFSGNKVNLAPQRLDVFSGAEGILPEAASVLEKVHTKAFLTDESVSVMASVRKWTFSAVGGFSALFRSMDRFDVQLNNRLRMLDGYVRLKAVYETNRFRAVFELPAGYSAFRFRGALPGVMPSPSVPDGGRFVYSPQLSFRWKINSRFWVNLSGNLGETPLSTDWFFSGTLRNNYQNMQQGAVYNAADRQANCYLGLNYKDPLSLFFASLSVARNWNKNATVGNQVFTPDYFLNTLALHQNKTNAWILKGELSKGVDFIKGKIAVEGSYTLLDMQTMRNGEIAPFRSSALALKGYVTSEFARWGNADYTLLYGRNGVTMGAGSLSASDFAKQQLSLNFTPLEWLILQVKGEHYYTQISEETSKHLFWLDAGMTVKINPKMEISLSASNLLNAKTYSYVVYIGLSSVSRQYTIRPLNLLCTLFLRF